MQSANLNENLKTPIEKTKWFLAGSKIPPELIEFIQSILVAILDLPKYHLCFLYGKPNGNIIGKFFISFMCSDLFIFEGQKK